MDAREAIVKIIMREVWGVEDDEDAGSVMPRMAGWAADAILAALDAAGLLDRTGGLLMRAAEMAGKSHDVVILQSTQPGGVWLSHFHSSGEFTYAGKTPADALEAAIAAAEEGR